MGRTVVPPSRQQGRKSQSWREIHVTPLSISPSSKSSESALTGV